MPFYTYECEECGVRFNKKQSFSDAPIDVCPECEGHVHKVIGPVGVVFKGSGFYVTDSRSNRNNLTGSGKKRDDDSSTGTGTESTGDSAQTQSQAKPTETKSTTTTSTTPKQPAKS